MDVFIQYFPAAETLFTTLLLSLWLGLIESGMAAF